MPALALIFSFLAFAINLVSPLATNGSENWDFPVQMTIGRMYGHEAPNASQAVEYFGIPYAQPPTGSIRFAAPRKYSTK
jgi:Carboxylesterase family